MEGRSLYDRPSARSTFIQHAFHAGPLTLATYAFQVVRSAINP